uniref:hypothetical protein n=1 Tax=Parabacteroides distasonis TaxID=823 RepID=UPI001BA8378E|nr:hypothetical protein [Parabacteroides distasonis]
MHPFVFCPDCARLGEKIPQRSEDDFFSQPVQRTALLDQGQKATFAGKKQKCGTLLDSKVENLYSPTWIYPPKKIHQGESVFKRFLGPFIVKWKYIASSISHNYLYFSYGLNLFLQTNSV